MPPEPRDELSAWLRWGKRELAFLDEREALQESETILEALLGVSRTELYLRQKADPALFLRFSQGIEARKKRVPLAYLLGKSSFWDEEFEVEAGIFIPRPETEVVVEAFLRDGGFATADSFRFLDLGTGSGNLAVTFAKLCPVSEGAASDISAKAVKVAVGNARRLGAGLRLRIIQADGLSGFQDGSFDVIVSNPPYIAREEWAGLDPEVREEPRVALDGGEDGLDFYRKVCGDLSCLKRGGSLWVEVGVGQAAEVRSLFENAGFREIKIFQDFNKIERVVAGKGHRFDG